MQVLRTEVDNQRFIQFAKILDCYIFPSATRLALRNQSQSLRFCLRLRLKVFYCATTRRSGSCLVRKELISIVLVCDFGCFVLIQTYRNMPNPSDRHLPTFVACLVLRNQSQSLRLRPRLEVFYHAHTFCFDFEVFFGTLFLR